MGIKHEGWANISYKALNFLQSPDIIHQSKIAKNFRSPLFSSDQFAFELKLYYQQRPAIEFGITQQHQQALIEKVTWWCFKKCCLPGQVTFWLTRVLGCTSQFLCSTDLSNLSQQALGNVNIFWMLFCMRTKFLLRIWKGAFQRWSPAGPLCMPSIGHCKDHQNEASGLYPNFTSPTLCFQPIHLINCPLVLQEDGRLTSDPSRNQSTGLYFTSCTHLHHCYCILFLEIMTHLGSTWVIVLHFHHHMTIVLGCLSIVNCFTHSWLV